MSTELRTEIEIEAPADRVWAVLVDFATYPEWNPFIWRIEGTATSGEQLAVRIEPPGGRGMTFRPTVAAVRPERELAWLGHLGVPGVFDGAHHLVLEPLGANRTRFVQREVFGGLLVPLMGGMLRKTEHGFARMNAALKARVEQAAAA